MFHLSLTSTDGYSNFFNAVKIAQLSLKHRMNKSQRQRIIIFVGHPVNEDLSECEKLGKRLKRNNVAIDVINFAHPDNVPKLEALVQCANQENSHFMDVPMGVAMITDVLITSPILQGDNAGNDVPMGDGGGAANLGDPVANRFAEYGGFNPDMDPEMAMAMKISMDEARANQKAADAEKAKEGGQL